MRIVTGEKEKIRKVADMSERDAAVVQCVIYTMLAVNQLAVDAVVNFCGALKSHPICRHRAKQLEGRVMKAAQDYNRYIAAVTKKQSTLEYYDNVLDYLHSHCSNERTMLQQAVSRRLKEQGVEEHEFYSHGATAMILVKYSLKAWEKRMEELKPIYGARYYMPDFRIGTIHDAILLLMNTLDAIAHVDFKSSDIIATQRSLDKVLTNPELICDAIEEVGDIED